VNHIDPTDKGEPKPQAAESVPAPPAGNNGHGTAAGTGPGAAPGNSNGPGGAVQPDLQDAVTVASLARELARVPAEQESR